MKQNANRKRTKPKYKIENQVFIYLNQQFITRHMKTDHSSYFIVTYKRNRLTRGLKLKGKEEKKEK